MANNFRNVAIGLAGLTALAGLAAGYEGLSTTAYHDTLAHGLPTVCYGETIGVKMGDHYSAQECRKMLQDELPRYWDAINPCIKVVISTNEKVAYTDFAYNVGSHAFCGSNLLKSLNAGDHKGACMGLMSWDHASGIEVRGLTRRRAAERSICLTPDSKKLATAVDTIPDATEKQMSKQNHSVLKPAPLTIDQQDEAAQELLKKHRVCHPFLFWKVCR